MQTQNRIVLPAMDMNVSEHGEIEQSEIDHYAARAKGGAGLIITVPAQSISRMASHQ